MGRCLRDRGCGAEGQGALRSLVLARLRRAAEASLRAPWPRLREGFRLRVSVVPARGATERSPTPRVGGAGCRRDRGFVDSTRRCGRLRRDRVSGAPGTRACMAVETVGRRPVTSEEAGRAHLDVRSVSRWYRLLTRRSTGSMLTFRASPSWACDVSTAVVSELGLFYSESEEFGSAGVVWLSPRSIEPPRRSREHERWQHGRVASLRSPVRQPTPAPLARGFAPNAQPRRGSAR